MPSLAAGGGAVLVAAADQGGNFAGQGGGTVAAGLAGQFPFHDEQVEPTQASGAGSNLTQTITI